MADGKERPIHENHRARMQERVAHNGMESLAEHEVLEYMLYLAIPRQDTNPLAHRLIDHFGSFCRVMEATPQELMQVKGVGPRSAQLISDIMEFGRYYAVKKRKKQATLDTTANAIEYIKPLFLGLQNEVLYIILMDDSCHPLYDLKAAEGVPNHVSIDTRKLLRDVLRSNASTAILSHRAGPAQCHRPADHAENYAAAGPGGHLYFGPHHRGRGERLLYGRPRPFAGHQRPPRHFKRRQYGFLSCRFALPPYAAAGYIFGRRVHKIPTKRLYITFQL